MDRSRIADLQIAVVKLREEIRLIKKKLFDCYLDPTVTLIPIDKARDYFPIFLTPADISKKLKKDRKGMVVLSHVLELIEEGFERIEKYEKPYARWVPRSVVKGIYIN